MQNRVFIYIRVSTKRQAEEGYSIPEQLERLKKYCGAMEWLIVGTYIDDGYTGSNMERPELQRMLADIEKGLCDIVLVDKIDRLARSLIDTVTMVDRLFKQHNVSFVSRAEAFDSNTQMGKACMVIMAMFAEIERERIAERMKDGKEGRAKEGLWCGSSYTPVGYVYDKESGVLQIDEYKAMQVKLVFDLYTSGKSLREIERYMKDHGYASGRGQYSAKSVKTIVANKVYCGYIRNNDDWIPAQHAPIIDMDTWKKAQERIISLRDNKHPNSRGSYYYTTYLGNFIYCPRCGAKFIRTYGGGTDPKTGKRRQYYTCASKCKRSLYAKKADSCDNKNWNVDKFDKLIFGEIDKLRLAPELMDSMVHSTSVDNSARISLIQKELKSLSEQASRLMDLYALGTIDISDIKAKTDHINLMKKNLTAELESLQSDNSNKTSRQEAITLIDGLHNMLNEGADMQDVRTVLERLIDKIEVDGSNINIFWKFL